MTDIQGNPSPGVRRRAIVKGAAWATPAVMVAAAAPTAAASPVIVPTFSPGTFCKHPGNPKFYHLVICFENNSASIVPVTLDTLAIGATVKPAFVSIGGAQTQSFTVAAGQSRCLYVDAGTYDNSANGAAVLEFSYIFGGATVQDQLVGGTITDSALNPCGTGAASAQPTDNPPHPSSGPTP